MSDASNLPDIIESLIGSSLDSLTLTVDGVTSPISNARSPTSLSGAAIVPCHAHEPCPPKALADAA